VWPSNLNVSQLVGGKVVDVDAMRPKEHISTKPK
jgi:hypothetical protein